MTENKQTGHTEIEPLRYLPSASAGGRAVQKNKGTKIL
ncbi:hypothetical protein CHK_3149 [Christensenella hongkongensis]|uniref:Uncharacterized protein n=1 Tax=Christensenella hongkongensis TaxID=270498 RepID=A0A0M2NF38_9FIRM|nr:hypothetical protein CHK_3149 [Christensenella hongkongensis]